MPRIRRKRRKDSILKIIELQNEQILEMRIYIDVLKKVLIESREKLNSEDINKILIDKK